MKFSLLSNVTKSHFLLKAVYLLCFPKHPYFLLPIQAVHCIVGYQRSFAHIGRTVDHLCKQHFGPRHTGCKVAGCHTPDLVRHKLDHIVDLYRTPDCLGTAIHRSILVVVADTELHLDILVQHNPDLSLTAIGVGVDLFRRQAGRQRIVYGCGLGAEQD